MSLVLILVFIGAAVLLGFIRHPRWRVYTILAASTMALFALQPTLPIRGLDFYLPILTLVLVICAWIVTTPREARTWRENWPGVAIPGGIVLILALTRYLDWQFPLTASRPPQIHLVLIFILLAAGISLVISRFTRPGRAALLVTFLAILFFFILLKVPAVSLQVSLLLRKLNGQALATASVFDIRWLGYSYIAFRLLHTVRDRQTGRLPQTSLAEYTVYAIFFPTLAAGPIDRIERFTGDLRQAPGRTAEDWGNAGRRLLIGMFKKFVIADGLSLMAVNGTNAPYVHEAGWAWIMLYAYAFQLFFDFSGYTDIAIGIGRLMGIKLPENFNSPFRKPNLTQFWNNWHMTLTQWFRAYFFNPVTRAMRAAKKPVPIPVIILLTQLATMVLIGLWHGVNLNYVLWGIWQGMGLFIHNRWSEWTKVRFATLPLGWQRVLNTGGMVLTFHFLALSWVLFALPEPGLSFRYFVVLFGLA
jgi:D-alanyl-lipoteichoic acid acyltransferase DltB (MBOAT superfamily)